MKNLDSKMRERFHRREQDEDRTLRIRLRQIEKIKAKDYSAKERDKT